MAAVWIDASQVVDTAEDDDHDTAHDASLAALVADLAIPDWHADAACREHPAEWWFPTQDSNTVAAARSVCERCLVRRECAAAALGLPNNTAGVWAGMTPRDRQALRRDAA